MQRAGARCSLAVGPQGRRRSLRPVCDRSIARAATGLRPVLVGSAVRRRRQFGCLPTIACLCSVLVLAEREGFEPSRELAPPTRLAGECLQPLGHLSGYRIALFRRKRPMARAAPGQSIERHFRSRRLIVGPRADPAAHALAWPGTEPPRPPGQSRPRGATPAIRSGTLARLRRCRR